MSCSRAWQVRLVVLHTRTSVLTGGGRGVCRPARPVGRERGSSAQGLALKGKCCPQQRLDKFNSFSDSEDDGLVKEWRIQPAPSRWRPATGRALSSGMMLQTFHLSVEQTEAFGQGFPSTPLLQPPLTFWEVLSKPPLRCLSPGEAMRQGGQVSA